MAVFSVPIGVRFHPTKLQLVDYFLRVKHSGQELPECYPQFLDFDVYSNHPFKILDSTKERRGVNDVNEGFFFCQLNKLTPNGKRISRCIKGIGTWSEKSKTTDVYNGNRVVGIEKYLKFKPDNDEEDEWMMHEYSRLRNDDEEDEKEEDNQMVVLCHITKKPVSTKRRMMDYEASSSKRGRVEYEQPSGFNNSGIIINPNHQDYVSRAVDEGYQVEPSNEASTKEKEGIILYSEDELERMLDVEDKDNVDNQAYEVDDGILQLTDLVDHQVYDMEPLLEEAEHGLSVSNNGAQEGDANNFHIEDLDQFLLDAEQAYWLPTEDSLTLECDFNNNACNRA